MINFTILRSAAEAKKYYHPHGHDYYIEDKSQVAFFGGKLADRLGLSEFSIDAFHDLCDGIVPGTSKTDPKTGKTLPESGDQLTPGTKGDKRAGYDVTMDGPKDLGILMALGLDDRIIPDVLERAGRDVMAMIERDAKTRVRVGKQDTDRNTGEIVYTGVLHTTARPVGNKIDVQPHYHFVVANATWDPVERRMKALQLQPWATNGAKEARPYYTAILNSKLAGYMQELGYQVERTKDTFKVVGIPESVRKEFSQRTNKIEAVAALLEENKRKFLNDPTATLNPSTKGRLGAHTREPKKPGKTWDSLLDHWNSRVTEQERHAILDTVIKSHRDPQLQTPDRSHEALTWSLDHLLERSAAVPERQVVTEALKYGLGSVSVEGVYEQLGRPGLIRRDGLVTTRGVLDEERGILAFAAKGRGKLKPLGKVEKFRPEESNPTVATERLNRPIPLQGNRTLTPVAGTNPDTATPPVFGQAASGHTRLFRVEPAQRAVHADWIQAAQAERGHTEAQDRWFVQDPAMLEWYRQDAKGPTITTYVDVPTADLERYRVRNVTEQISGRTPVSFSKDPDNEFFLPRPLADSRQAVVAHGQGTKNLAPQNEPVPTDKLSPSQQAAVRHVLTSPDRVILIRGAAGTGKTTLTKAALSKVNVPWVILAPSSDASRNVLRRDGFEKADTLAAFLNSKEMQEGVRGGLVWLDEASLAGSRDVAKLTQLADSLNARVILSGDRRQHKSVARGDVLGLLEDRAGLPCAEVSDIKRQHGEYKAAVKLASQGRAGDALAKLDEMGWVREGDSNLADEYTALLKKGKDVLVVSPTHADGDKLTGAIRQRLKEEGRLHGQEERFTTLENAQLTEAQRQDPETLKALEGAQAVFVRHSEGRRAGDRVAITTDNAEELAKHGDRYVVYRPKERELAEGDLIRITAGCKDLTGKHRINNGTQYTVSGFTSAGNIKLSNGWTLDKNAGTWSHGYVQTSYAAQGKTADIVLVSMPTATLPAVDAASAYVAISRGRHQAVVFTDDKDQLLDAVQRQDNRTLATDLVRRPRHKLKERLRKHLSFIRSVGTRVVDKVMDRERQPQVMER
ncbi:MobF family relaxase [Zavarzinella formosa]|uniref:MobF family relaxase n=1 Tax=Zavarzinella formosa TaxID=360055 RepID=UPI00030D41F7|nr:MobF family relaxase [Zavarzinella formosa]